jgi:hypothetical protein
MNIENDFEDWYQENHDKLLEEFINTHDHVYKETYEESAEWENFTDKKFTEFNLGSEK